MISHLADRGLLGNEHAGRARQVENGTPRHRKASPPGIIHEPRFAVPWEERDGLLEDDRLPNFGHRRSPTSEWPRPDLPMAPRWMKDAVCVEHPEVDFLGRAWKEAIAICQGCLVRTECLEYALREDMRDGVWGGMSRKQRLALVRPVPLGAVVYFATDSSVSFVKIGCSIHVEQRLKELGLHLLATEPGRYQRETELHKRFAHLRIQGETFLPTAELLSYIDGLTAAEEAAA